MSRYLAIVFADLVRHSDEWARLPRDEMVKMLGEYRYLAESLAGQYGCAHRQWTGDGHMFLFEGADAAARFGLRLLESWQGRSAMPLRVGAHFGDCDELPGGDWIGRSNNLAKRVEGEADSDTLYVTENLLDLLDLPLYEVETLGDRPLKGDHLATRRLYRIVGLRADAGAVRSEEELTADDWYLRGAALIGTPLENGDEEERSYREALRLRPEYAEAHANLGALLAARGSAAEAARHYRAALEARPDYPEAHYNYAALLASEGRYAGADEHYREALRLRVDYVDARHGFANLLALQGAHDEACAQYDAVLELRPDYAEAHSNYAVVLDRMGEPDRAAEHYRCAIELRPGYAEAHYNLALLLDLGGDATEAERHYREALTLRPAYPEAQNNLAVLLQLRGDLEQAERLYLAALEARPDDPEAHYNLGLLLRARGDERGAERHLRTARELAPG